MKLWILVLLGAGVLPGDTWSYWIQPCTPEAARESACEAADGELGKWALDAWQKASAGAIQVAPEKDENKARIRIYWASGRSSLYGEARPILVEGKRGAAIFVLPNLAVLGPSIEAAGRNDRLFRDSIVYLTCLHESGHALGLPHTREFADIMYSFGYGGDVVEYFSRYRRTVKTRADIASSPGISDADRAALKAVTSRL